MNNVVISDIDNKTQEIKLSNAQPLWMLILLYLTTFGFYNIYWFYKNWKQLKAQNNLKILPWLRTIGLFVPFVFLFLIAFQFMDIENFAKKNGCKSYSYPILLAILFLFLFFFGRIVDYLKLPSVFQLGSLLGVIPLAIVQNTLNRYWAKVQVGCVQRTKLVWQEILTVILGSIFMLFVLVGIFIQSST